MGAAHPQPKCEALPKSAAPTRCNVARGKLLLAAQRTTALLCKRDANAWVQRFLGERRVLAWMRTPKIASRSVRKGSLERP